VGWSDSIDEVQQIAQLKKKPYAIYFATKEELKVVGEPTDSIKAYAAANGNTLPSTVFELPKIIDQFRGMGVVEFVKVANDKENRDTVAAFGGGNATLVIVAPDGAKIGAYPVLNGNLVALMTNAKAAIDAWQQKQSDIPAKN
jgi:hypothetical protein